MTKENKDGFRQYKVEFDLDDIPDDVVECARAANDTFRYYTHGFKIQKDKIEGAEKRHPQYRDKLENVYEMFATMRCCSEKRAKFLEMRDELLYPFQAVAYPEARELFAHFLFERVVEIESQKNGEPKISEMGRYLLMDIGVDEGDATLERNKRVILNISPLYIFAKYFEGKMMV